MRIFVLGLCRGCFLGRVRRRRREPTQLCYFLAQLSEFVTLLLHDFEKSIELFEDVGGVG
ncbi:hypothetical protein FP66_14515 [Halomonas salina]|uniref:Uncharacterized protein n=1 Tax=Halomonas salina TaxID=42565 RepID=A0ABR4WQ84_9GAMM|nr:hypothetical protein FP66_14515 [Halomonas salina]